MEKDNETERRRTREFVRLEREQAAHPASKALHRKPRGARSGAEVRQYTRIERGREA